MEVGQSYAYVALKRGVDPVLLVADDTYGYNGLEASLNRAAYDGREMEDDRRWG